MYTVIFIVAVKTLFTINNTIYMLNKKTSPSFSFKIKAFYVLFYHRN